MKARNGTRRHRLRRPRSRIIYKAGENRSMSHERQTPAVIIDRRHQSAPAATPLDRAVQQADEEMDGGRWIDDGNDEGGVGGLGLAVGLGSSGAAVGEKPTLDDFQTTRELNQIGRHPRVLEAIA